MAALCDLSPQGKRQEAEKLHEAQILVLAHPGTLPPPCFNEPLQLLYSISRPPKPLPAALISTRLYLELAGRQVVAAPLCGDLTSRHSRTRTVRRKGSLVVICALEINHPPESVQARWLVTTFQSSSNRACIYAPRNSLLMPQAPTSIGGKYNCRCLSQRCRFIFLILHEAACSSFERPLFSTGNKLVAILLTHEDPRDNRSSYVTAYQHCNGE